MRRARFGGGICCGQIWPLSAGWAPLRFERKRFAGLEYDVTSPVFGLRKPEGSSDEVIVAKLEREASEILGPWNRKEHAAFLKICKHEGRVNHCFADMKVSYEARVVPPPPIRRVRGVGNVGS